MPCLSWSVHEGMIGIGQFIFKIIEPWTLRHDAFVDKVTERTGVANLAKHNHACLSLQNMVLQRHMYHKASHPYTDWLGHAVLHHDIVFPVSALSDPGSSKRWTTAPRTSALISSTCSATPTLPSGGPGPSMTPATSHCKFLYKWTISWSIY